MNTEMTSGDTQQASSSRDGACHQRETHFVEQFQEIQKLLNCQEIKDFINDVKGHDIVLFLGNSKSGKSTLINYAIGNELKAVKMKEFPFTMAIVKGNEAEKGPLISSGSVSETCFPSVWPAPMLGVEGKVVDAPGFEDNRGEAQDIANTFYIKEIIRNARSVKFVLSTDTNDLLSHNISNFTNFVDKIHQICPETRVLHGGIALVMSKGSPTCSSAEICTFLKKMILDHADLHVKKSLIQYFVEHEECVTFFEMPSAEGIINNIGLANSPLDVVKNKLTGIPRHSLLNVKPGISDKSKVFLLLAQAEFCKLDQYIVLLQNVKDAFSKMVLEIYQAESIDEVKIIDEKLLRLHETVYSLVPSSVEELSLTAAIDKLSSLYDASGIPNVMDESNIAIQTQFVEFVDEVVNVNQCKIVVTRFQSTVETIKKEISEGRILAASKLKKITEKEAECQKRILTEKHMEEIKKYEESIRKQELKNDAVVKSQLENMDLVDIFCAFTKKVLSKIIPRGLQ